MSTASPSSTLPKELRCTTCSGMPQKAFNFFPVVSSLPRPKSLILCPPLCLLRYFLVWGIYMYFLFHGSSGGPTLPAWIVYESIDFILLHIFKPCDMVHSLWRSALMPWLSVTQLTDRGMFHNDIGVVWGWWCGRVWWPLDDPKISWSQPQI